MRIQHLHFTEVASTMEVARQEASELDFLLVTAERQTQGRGTKGRPWQSPKGNVYLTAAIHRRFLSATRLRLFPLEAGLVLWEAAATFISPGKRMQLRLKWPNDLLWDERKTAGMLLESAGNHMLIGVGINIAEAPLISDGGTPSACLAEAGADLESAPLVANAFFECLQLRLSPLPSTISGTSQLTETAVANYPDVLSEWQAKALWDTSFYLRDRPGRPKVRPVEVNSDGHLCVRFADAHEEWLVSEYLA
jgi:biotin-[acetyl-CoA-carboxylase] ligase BirA-like protein